MRIPKLLAVVSLAFVAAHPLAARGQQQKGKALDVFLDCETGGCYDFDFFRRQIPYVNWVRDRQVADLQILITSRACGRTGG